MQGQGVAWWHVTCTNLPLVSLGKMTSDSILVARGDCVDEEHGDELSASGRVCVKRTAAGLHESDGPTHARARAAGAGAAES